jgi:hypothetical protein
VMSNGTVTGSGNTSIGAAASQSLTSGSYNTVLGYQPLLSATTGSYNIAIGYQALNNVTSGTDNIMLGRVQNTNGSNITTGSNNILIGYNAGLGRSTSESNFLNIGNSFFGIMNATSSAASLPTDFAAVRFGIGTSSPWAMLSINPTAGLTGPAFVIGSSTATNFIVTNGGNVGVGTTSPSAALSVHGTTLLNNNLTMSAGQILASSGSASAPGYGFSSSVNSGFYLQSGGDMQFVRAGATKFTIQANYANFDSSVQLVAKPGTASSPSYSFNAGSVNTGIFGDVSHIGFSVTGSEKMRIDSSGNVGIGTTSPMSKLSVDGNIQISSGKTIGGGVIAETDITSYFKFGFNELFDVDDRFSGVKVSSVANGANFSGGQIGFFVTNAQISLSNEAMRITNTGNVGIGTTSPFGLLSVEQGTETASLWIGNTGSSTPSLMVSGVNGDGKVGIGTNSPTAKLDITGNTGTGSSLVVSNATTGAGRGISVTMNGASGSGATAGYFFSSNYSGTGVHGELNVSGGGSGGYGGKFVVSGGPGAGNYGVYGETNATGLSYGVYGTITGTGNVGYAGRFVNTGGNTATNFGVSGETDATGVVKAVQGLATGASNTGYAGYFSNNSASGWGVYSAGTSPNYFAGNVGIGTTSPGTNLSVTGSGNFTGNVVAGSVASNLWYPLTGQGTGNGQLVLYNSTLAGRMILGAENSAGGTIVSSAISDGVFRNKQRILFSADDGSTAHMTITTTGNVGIGTTNPGATFQVGASTLTVSATTTNVGIGITNPAGPLDILGGTSALVQRIGRVQSANNNGIFLQFAGGTGGVTQKGIVGITHTGTSGDNIFVGELTDALAIRSEGAIQLGPNGSVVATLVSGNVGIGTTTPGRLLDLTVSATGYAPQLRINNQTISGDVRSTLEFTQAGTLQGYIGTEASSATMTDFVINAYQAKPMVFMTNNTEWMRITSDGNVGIGTVSPQTTLHVNSADAGADTNIASFGIGGDLGASNVGMRIAAQGAANYNRVGWLSGNWNHVTDTKDVAGLGAWSLATNPNDVDAEAASGFSFQTATVGETSLTTRLAILQNGNVGIGTSTPSTKLHVASGNSGGTPYGSSQLTLENSSSVYLQMMSPNNQVNAILFGDPQSIEAGAIYYNHATNYLDFRTNGTTQRMIIDSSGVVSIANLVSCGGIQTNGAGTMSCTSDERLKDIQNSFTSGLSAISQINPQTYSWKADSGLYDGGIEYSGFIAQNVQSAIPQAISTSTQGYLQVSPTTILAAAVNAIKELDQRTSWMNNSATSTVMTVLANGNIGIGTSTPNHTLSVAGEIGAIAFINTSTKELKTDINYATASSTSDMLTQLTNLKVATYRYKIESQQDPLRIGLIAEDTQAIAPEILSLDGKGIDLYKLATFTLAGVQALADKVNAQETRITSLEERLAALESGAVSSASGSPITLSTSSLASALEGFSVLIQKGIAQFNTLVFRQLVASKDADGTSSAGSVSILAGNTVAQVNNSLVMPSTKVFITFNSQITGSWWVSDKASGSFRVILSSPQVTDVSFDYFLVQTEGQIATSTPISNSQLSSSNDTTAPVITLLGANPLYLALGVGFTDPGVTVSDNSPVTTYVNGIEGGAVDTSVEKTYIITYRAVSAAGVSATAQRSVIVGSPAASEPTAPVSADTVPPVVTLVGEAALQLTVGDIYTDAGATATDDVDGDLTTHIIVSGSVDTATVGSYTLTYTATDAAGNTGSVSRLVTVAASSTTP